MNEVEDIMTMIKPAGQQKLFNEKALQLMKLFPIERACIPPTVSSSTITGEKQKHWINFVVFLRF